jgi:hypothetical protein
LMGLAAAARSMSDEAPVLACAARGGEGAA